jgi:hypothetical protein
MKEAQRFKVGRSALRGSDDTGAPAEDSVSLIRPQGQSDWALACVVWEIVYRYGQALPNDMVV